LTHDAAAHGSASDDPTDDAVATALQRRLIAGLCLALRPAVSPTPVGVLETHISYVLLTGTRAYKIKKAVRLGFLDFTTLEARRFYCEQELTLNRRLAPALYLAVDPDNNPHALALYRRLGYEALDEHRVDEPWEFADSARVVHRGIDHVIYLRKAVS
jgi:hypothetical protein